MIYLQWSTYTGGVCVCVCVHCICVYVLVLCESPAWKVKLFKKLLAFLSFSFLYGLFQFSDLSFFV